MHSHLMLRLCVDIDPSEINKVIDTDLGIVADCKRVLEALFSENVSTAHMNNGFNTVKPISRNIHLNMTTTILRSVNLK